MKGRVASLLEVGTGFHPELTGRENIFLNGSILGMRKHEIARKLDEIIDFSGVERYIDTPVKRYSSGMYVRLAFAVAAHLESEILIVDEVLAVGDAEFQKKCLGKLERLSLSEYRTILFVSHQLGSIKQLCSKVLLLNNGQIEKMDLPENTVSHYLSHVHSNIATHFEAKYIVDQPHYFLKRFSSAFVEGNPSFVFGLNNPIVLNLSFGYSEVNSRIEFAIAIFDINDFKVLTIHELLFNTISQYSNGEIQLKIKLPDNYLAPGDYYFNIAVHIPHMQLFHLVERINKITVVDSGSSFSGYSGVNIGVVMPKYSLII
jgi:lipopolysaccharide transport system ATP-binding protein